MIRELQQYFLTPDLELDISVSSNHTKSGNVEPQLKKAK